MPDSQPTFLITGASTGIGAATARHAVAAGYRVVRPPPPQENHTPPGGDRRRADPPNAGCGGARSFSPEKADPVDDWKAMILTNVYGAALTIRATIEHVKAAKGHMLLTGSVAGRRSLPGSLYSATKFAVTGMGESLRQELNGTGVRVTLVEPGMVDTPFFENRPSLHALEGDDVARAVMYAVQQPPHVDVNELLIRPTDQDG